MRRAILFQALHESLACINPMAMWMVVQRERRMNGPMCIHPTSNSLSDTEQIAMSIPQGPYMVTSEVSARAKGVVEISEYDGQREQLHVIRHDE